MQAEKSSNCNSNQWLRSQRQGAVFSKVDEGGILEGGVSECYSFFVFDRALLRVENRGCRVPRCCWMHPQLKHYPWRRT